MPPEKDNAAAADDTAVILPEDAFAAAFAEITAPVKDAKADAATTDEDELDAAAKAAKDDSKTDDAAAGDGAADATAKKDDAAAGDAAAGDGSEGDGGGGDAAADGKATGASAPDAAALQATIDKLTADLAAAKAAPAAKDDDSEDVTTSTKGKAQDAPAETPYSEKEQALIDKVSEDFPELLEAQALVRGREYQKVARYIFAEIHKAYGPILERAVQTTEQVSETSALSMIRSAHNDYDEAMENAIVAWANNLPGFRKKTAQAVISDGETQDVIDLITAWKQETGKSKPRVVADGGKSTAAGDTQSGKKPAAPLSDKAKQAAGAMAARDTKRTAIGTDEPDKDDFDAAFKEALATK